MGSNNIKDITEGRLRAVKSNNERNVFDTLAMDCFILEIISIFIFIFFPMLVVKKNFGEGLTGEDIIQILNESNMPIFIFLIFVTVVSIFKLIKYRRSVVKDSTMKFYKFALSFNVIFTILFLSAYIVF